MRLVLHIADFIKLCYTYDELDRVTKRTELSICDNTVISEQSFSYDAQSNITTADGQSFSYDANNRLTLYNSNNVSYDDDGNMLSNGEMNFEYDALNRLTCAGEYQYTYNAENVRIGAERCCHNTLYTYDTVSKLSKLLVKVTDNVTTKYVYGLGPIGEEKCGEFKVYRFDYL